MKAEKQEAFLECARQFAAQNSLQLIQAQVAFEFMKFHMTRLDFESVEKCFFESTALFKSAKRSDKVAEIENIYANFQGEIFEINQMTLIYTTEQKK
jgi:hypothetical protein